MNTVPRLLHRSKPLVAPDEDGASILALRVLYFEDLSIGQTESFAKMVSSSDVVGFAEVTGDRNPIHLSEHFAAQTAFGTRIAHGLYTAGTEYDDETRVVPICYETPFDFAELYRAYVQPI